jgi:hypothetical protein
MAINLVTSSEIVKNTPMGGNVDPDKYTHLINDVQVLILEPILGTKLYDKILTDFNADTLAGLYLQMYENYLKQIVWHSVFADYAGIGSIWFNNGGSYRHASEDSETPSQDDLNKYIKRYESKADAYISRLEDFLCDKGSEISEYNDTQDNEYDVDPKTGVRTISGLFFGKNL